MELVFSSLKRSGLGINWERFQLKRGHNSNNNSNKNNGKNSNCHRRRKRYHDKRYKDYYGYNDYGHNEDNDYNNDADDADNSIDTTTDSDTTVADYSEPESESIFGERCCSWFWVNWDSQWEAFFVFSLFQLYNFLMVAFSPVIYPAYAIYISVAFLDQETYWSDSNEATALFGHMPNIYWYMFSKFFFIDYLM